MLTTWHSQSFDEFTTDMMTFSNVSDGIQFSEKYTKTNVFQNCLLGIREHNSISIKLLQYIN